MRILLLIALGLSIIAITVAPAPKKGNKSRDVDVPAEGDKTDEKDSSANSGSGKSSDADKETPKSKKEPPKKPAKKDTNDDTSKKAKKTPPSPTTSKNSRNSKSTPAKKSAKKQAKESLGIEEDLADILKDDDPVEIPNPSQVASTTIDPIELAQKIKKVADPTEKKNLATKLRAAMNKNKNSSPGKFYQAAYAALQDENRAANFWRKELEKKMSEEIQNSANVGAKGNIGGDLLSRTGSGIGDGIQNAKNLVEADPVGMLLRRGESGVLGGLSGGAKGLGKLSDVFYDSVGNLSKLVRAVTFPVDAIPIASGIKNNVHNFIEDGARRGKYLSGTFSDNASEALENAANDADREASEREEKLRRFSNSRRNSRIL